MNERRHRAPPEPPAAANGLWMFPAGLAVLAATVAVASLLGPSPDPPDAVESPRRTVAQSGAIRTLPPLNVPTVTASETATQSALSASVRPPQPRRVPVATPQRTTSAPEAPKAAPPVEPIPPAEEPAAPIEETEAVVEPEQPAETAEPTPTDEPEPTEATTPTDVVEDIFDVTEPEVREP